MPKSATVATPVDAPDDVAAPVDGTQENALQKPVDTSAIATPVDTSGPPEPSTRRRGRAPVDGPPPATYEHAQRFASGKGQHRRPPGSLELPNDTWGGYNDRDSRAKCQGQLRSVYARITTASAHYGQAGKTSWVPVAVWCDGCAAVWTKPLDPGEATRQRPGRW